MTSDLPWADGLKKSGLYCDGFMDDIEAVLKRNSKETVTFYGTRNSGVAATNCQGLLAVAYLAWSSGSSLKVQKCDYIFEPSFIFHA